MHQYISSARYLIPLEAALKQLGAVVPEGAAERSDACAALDRARQTLTTLAAELPSPAEAFDDLLDSIESRFGSLERDAWLSEVPLTPSEHASAIRAALKEVASFCSHVIDDEALSAAAYSESEALLAKSGVLERMATSFEADGKGGQYRSDLTDELLQELRTSLSAVVSERMGLDLTLPE